MIYRDGTIRNQQLFDEWSELNWEIRGYSPVLMGLDTVHAYHVKQDVAGVEYLPNDFFIQPGGGLENNFVVSYMESKDGEETYIMLFNKDETSEQSCLFNIDEAEELNGLEYFDPHTGEYIDVDISDGCIEGQFLAGEGKLYRLNYTSEDESGDKTESGPDSEGTESEPDSDSTESEPDSDSTESEPNSESTEREPDGEKTKGTTQRVLPWVIGGVAAFVGVVVSAVVVTTVSLKRSRRKR